MPRIKHPARSFEQIFEQAKVAGAENIMLNDAEVGVVLAGGGQPVTAATIANRRWRGKFNAPVQYGSDRHVITRLSDVLAERDHRSRRRAIGVNDMKCNHPYTERGNACVQCFRELEAELEHEKYMGTKCAEVGYELKADNQRLRDAIASYHDHHKQWEEYCYKCNPQG